MPTSKSTIAPTPNYTRIHTLVDAYKISIRWWDDRGRWIAFYSAPERDDGVQPCMSEDSSRSSVDAVVKLLTALGHGNEVYV